MSRKSSFDASCSKYDYGGRGRMRQNLARYRGTKEERLAQTQKDEEDVAKLLSNMDQMSLKEDVKKEDVEMEGTGETPRKLDDEEMG